MASRDGLRFDSESWVPSRQCVLTLNKPLVLCRATDPSHLHIPLSPLTNLSLLAPAASKGQMMEERANLMHMMKLSIKVLLQSALSLGRSLDADHAPLQQFFVVMEHCLKHGLKGEPGGV